jgi:hypothetical protein
MTGNMDLESQPGESLFFSSKQASFSPLGPRLRVREARPQLSPTGHQGMPVNSSKGQLTHFIN